ncbi:MAG: hypothetical protein ACTSXT_13700 [Candidatus Helarchaeota archaeon]
MEQPETYKLITPFKAHLELRDSRWKMLNIHGNLYTSTIPDKLLIHPEYGMKLVEFKIIYPSGHVHLSKNQKADWKIYIAHGLKFWVIAAKDLRGIERRALREKLYLKLFDSPNCEFILSKFNHKYLYI